MSLILDALRKMELERKAKRQSSPQIRSEVLNYRGNPSPPEKSRFLPVIVVLLLLAAGAASFFFIQQSKSPRTEPATAAAPDTAGTTPRLPVPATPLVPVSPAQPVQQAFEKKPPETAVSSGSRPLVQHSPGDDTISISGIAWQEERPRRRAVINGTLYGEGADVLGAKIVEIKENRVRFSRGGTVFEISYPSGAGK